MQILLKFIFLCFLGLLCSCEQDFTVQILNPKDGEVIDAEKVDVSGKFEVSEDTSIEDVSVKVGQAYANIDQTGVFTARDYSLKLGSQYLVATLYVKGTKKASNSVVVERKGQNSTPNVGEDQQFMIDEDFSLSFNLNPGTDPDGQELIYKIIQAPSHGEITGCLDNSGSLNCIYVPTPNYFGNDSITYKANDGTIDSEEIATISIQIIPKNDYPEMGDDQSFEIDENEELVFTLNGASDIDGDELVYELVKLPNNSTLTECLQSDDDLTCKLIPDEFFSGEISFTYKAFDGKLYSSTEAQVSINVRNTIPDDNKPPILSLNPNAGELIRINRPLFTIPYSDLESGISLESLEVYMDGELVNDRLVIDPDKALLQFTSAWPLGNGNHTLYAKIKDNFGNLAEVTGHYIVSNPIISSAYITGVVLSQNGEPIEGAQIVDQQSPLGVSLSSETDENGEFKIPFSTSGKYFIKATKNGYVDGARYVDTISGRDAHLGNIILATADSIVTPISASNGGVAQNSTGTINIEIAPGALDEDINLNVTEFTVGESLPGPLPELSAFTYAFDPQPRGITYNSSEGSFSLENTLGFAPGSKLVYGYYDEDIGRWLDSGFDVIVGDNNKLLMEAMSLPPAFNPVDINQPSVCRYSCTPPNPPGPPPPPPQRPKCPGCVINIFTGDLAVEHDLPMVKRFNKDFGLSFTYVSTTAKPNFFVQTGLVNNFPEPADSVEGKISLGNKTIDVELSGDAILGESLIRFLVEAKNAENIYLPTGSYSYTAELSTLYTESEYATATYFGAPPGVPMGVIARVPLRFRSQSNGRVAIVNRRNSPFGIGWSLKGLESLHLDPEGTVLLDEGGMGTTFFTPLSPAHSSSKLSKFNLAEKLTSKSHKFDSTPQITSLVSKNGFIYASDCANNSIYRINLDASFEIVAGNGERGFTGDLGLATNASLNCPKAVYPADRGGFYIADSGNKRIRKVSRLGIITTIAGDGTLNEGEDGKLASMAGIGIPTSVSEDKMRAVYFTVGDKVRMVNPRGKLETYSSSTQGYVSLNLDKPSQILFDEFDYPIYVDKNNNRILSVYPQADMATVLLGEEEVNGKSINESGILKPVNLTFDSILKRYFILDESGKMYVWNGKGSKKVKELFINSDGLVLKNDDVNDTKSKVSVKAQTYVDGLGLVLSNGEEIYIPQSLNNLAKSKAKEIATSYVGEKAEYRDLYKMSDGSYELVDVEGNKSIFAADGKLIAKTNPEDQNIYYYYNDIGAIDKIMLPSSDYFKFNYDGRGFLENIVDPAGKITEFDINQNGHLLKIINPDESFKVYEYSNEDLLTLERDEVGLESRFEYEYSRVIRETRSDGTVRNINPEMLQGLVGYINNKTKNNKIFAPIVRPEDIKVSIESESGNCPIESTYRNGNSIRSVTDCLGRTTSFNTDDNGNITFKNTSANRTYYFTHDEKGRIKTSQDENGLTQYFYDEQSGKVTKIIDQNKSEMLFEYFPNSKLKMVTDFDGVKTSFQYNEFGNLTHILDHFGNVVREFEYGPGQNMSISRDISGLESLYTRNDQGLITLSQENYGANTSFSFDNMGRLEFIEDTLNGETSFTYRGDGKITSITDAREATTAYAFNNPFSLLSDTLNALNQSELLTYNEEELISEITQRDGTKISLEYDLMQNLTQKLTSDNLIQNFYDDDNVLVETRDNDSFVYMEYGEGNGALLSNTTQSNLVSNPIYFSYFSDGRRESLSFRINDSGNPPIYNYLVNYNYTKGGQVKDLTANLFGVQINWTASFDEKMRIEQATINDTVQTNYNFDLLDRITRIQNKTSSNLLVSEFDYTYSTAGNITSWTQKTELGNRPLSLTYDKLNRIISSSSGENFDYDILGNRTNYNSTYNLINQLIEDQEYSYTYTLNGNLETKTHKYSGEQTKYFWNVENQLIKAEKYNSTQEQTYIISYRYDSLGRRIERSVQNIKEPNKSYIRKFVFDNEDIIAELNEENQPVAAYLHGEGIDNLLAMVRDVNGDGTFSEDETFYFTKDHLGSIRELVDFEGKIVQRYDYSVYGKTTIADHDQSRFNKLIENRYAYTSREIEEELGDYYYRARYYSPDTGRFLSEDPIKFKGRDFNLYRYVFNNPTLFKDPTGLTSYECSYEILAGLAEHTYVCVGDICDGLGPETNSKADVGFGQTVGGTSNSGPSPGEGGFCGKIKNSDSENDSSCIDKCLLKSMTKAKPDYNLYSSNCQQYTENQISSCIASCM